MRLSPYHIQKKQFGHTSRSKESPKKMRKRKIPVLSPESNHLIIQKLKSKSGLSINSGSQNAQLPLTIEEFHHHSVSIQKPEKRGKFAYSE
jgi:hypothetical protein